MDTLKVGDLVITKEDNRVGCLIEIKKQRWAGICAKILFFDVGTTNWKKIENIRLLDKTDKKVYNEFRVQTKDD
tara:strand:+ start:417 stop:638 length:222 start_codon:yes stop_codon:yes gene_type:complete